MVIQEARVRSGTPFDALLLDAGTTTEEAYKAGEGAAQTEGKGAWATRRNGSGRVEESVLGQGVRWVEGGGKGVDVASEVRSAVTSECE
jgi:hypothetical protein